jgi:hypothetical protein
MIQIKTNFGLSLVELFEADDKAKEKFGCDPLLEELKLQLPVSEVKQNGRKIPLDGALQYFADQFQKHELGFRIYAYGVGSGGRPMKTWANIMRSAYASQIGDRKYSTRPIKIPSKQNSAETLMQFWIDFWGQKFMPEDIVLAAKYMLWCEQAAR